MSARAMADKAMTKRRDVAPREARGEKGMSGIDGRRSSLRGCNDVARALPPGLKTRFLMYCARALIVALFLALCASCVTDLPRYANPAQIERTALGLNSEDLILIDVVWGLEPESFLGSLRWKKHTELLISIPLVPGAGPPFWLIDPRHTQLSARQRLFRTGCSPQFLPEDRRQSEDLLLASDLPAGQGRQYSLRNVRRADGGVDLELSRRNETRSSDERVGFVPLPSEYTPPEIAPVWLYLAAPPLLVVDIASLAAGLVFVVVTTPILIVSIFTSAWE